MMGMGRVRPTPKARLICGAIFQREDIFKASVPKLEEEFGRVDFVSDVLPFEHTDYYREEMGEELKRRFLSFYEPIEMERLPKIKLITNRLEEEFSINGKRQINLDPGYLTLSKLVLATTKDFSHRIYLGNGIYGEVTLYYKRKAWRAWPWTYPDYKTEAYLGIFEEIRRIYSHQLKDLIKKGKSSIR
jgi:hypothetical protein